MLEKSGVRNLCSLQGLKCYLVFWHEDQLTFYVGVNHIKLAELLIPYFEGALIFETIPNTDLQMS